VRAQPVGHRQQARHRRLKLLNLFQTATIAVGHPHAGGDLRLVDIKRALALNENVHLNLPIDNHGPSIAGDLENRRD
jgi:hypothetical protein